MTAHPMLTSRCLFMAVHQDIYNTAEYNTGDEGDRRGKLEDDRGATRRVEIIKPGEQKD